MISIHGVGLGGFGESNRTRFLVVQMKKDILNRGRVPHSRHKHFTVVDNALLFKGWYVIPTSSPFNPILLQNYHDHS